MSTNQNGTSNPSKRNGGKAVRFAPQHDETQHHRSQHMRTNSDADDTPRSRRKRPRMERPNEDEQDDVDDWVDDEEHIGASTKELLDAKRTRKLKRQQVEDDDMGEQTHVDASTSLAADENPDKDVPIEPFNLKNEQTDGSGYFDGDTYVFRKRDDDEEPDAWVESMDDQKLPATIKQKTNASSDESEEEGENMDRWSREELYAKLIPLVSDTETVLQALVRFGELLKRKGNNGNKQQETATSMAQEALDTLTEASNALLLKGDVDVYQKTRNDLMKLVPTTTTTTDPVPSATVQWEYRGNQDGQIHGPYTTDQMKSWIGAGYFIGDQAVQIRTVAPATTDAKKDKPTVDDLLSDLMEDDDEQEGQQKQEVRGEWRSSNDVDFTAYSL